MSEIKPKEENQESPISEEEARKDVLKDIPDLEEEDKQETEETFHETKDFEEQDPEEEASDGI